MKVHGAESNAVLSHERLPAAVAYRILARAATTRYPVLAPSFPVPD